MLSGSQFDFDRQRGKRRWGGDVFGEVKTFSPRSEYGKWARGKQEEAASQAGRTARPNFVHLPNQEVGVSQSRHGDVTLTAGKTAGRGYVDAHDTEGKRIGNLTWSADTGEVEGVVVDPRHRGKGVARALASQAVGFSSQVERLAPPAPSAELSADGQRLVNRMRRRGAV